MGVKTRQVIEWVCRIGLAAVFIVAAVPKVLHPHDFALAVFRYQMAPYALVNLVATTLPWIELITALVLLCVPRWRDAAALVMFGMLAFFACAMAINIFRGIDIACGCFSVSEEAESMGWLNIARNVVLMAMAAVVFRGASSRRPPVM